MRRLELGAIRICTHCGRGRAELVSDDGGSLDVRLGPVRARLLADFGAPRPDDVPWLGELVAAHAATANLRVADVVFDDGAVGIRGLVTWADPAGAITVTECEADEALEAAVRFGVPMFATRAALDRRADDGRSGHTLH